MCEKEFLLETRELKVKVSAFGCGKNVFLVYLTGLQAVRRGDCEWPSVVLFFSFCSFLIAACLFCCLELTKIIFSHYLEDCFLVLISRCDEEKLFFFFVVLIFTHQCHSGVTYNSRFKESCWML